MLPFRGENRGVKCKNDYYYIIKLGIFQRKSEETRHHFPNGTLLPGAMLLSAIWKITVEDFPAFILVDDKGNDFFKQLKPWTPCKECQK